MKLTAKPVRGTGARHKAPASTTTPGYRNPNRQIVVRDTKASSKVRDRQSIYELRCEACGYRYGCNGLDIKARLCPACQGGVQGEPMPETPQASLFGEP